FEVLDRPSRREGSLSAPQLGEERASGLLARWLPEGTLEIARGGGRHAVRHRLARGAAEQIHDLGVAGRRRFEQMSGHLLRRGTRAEQDIGGSPVQLRALATAKR